jgi:hypothetical protein
MAISRSQMGSQLTGNKMKKTKKKNVGGLLGAMAGNETMLPLGIIPQMLYREHQKKNAATDMPDMPDAPTAVAGPMTRPDLPARGMKRGGKVRGDGVCQRGKTKGTMR